MVDVTLAVMAVTGLAISTWFTALACGWIRSDSRYLPAFCRLDRKTCGRLTSAPQARLFGLPNSVLGQVYYGGILVVVALGGLELDWLCRLAVTMALLTLLLAVYLTYSLVVVLRAPCILCFASHLLNFGIFLLLLKRCA